MRLLRAIRLVLFVCIHVLLVQSAIGQDRHFVYLQSDKGLPFYIKINGRNISSSPIGYAIIPRLTDSTYEISIGFAGSSNVQQYELVVTGANQGYLLKDFVERGFGLFNLQTAKVQI